MSDREKSKKVGPKKRKQQFSSTSSDDSDAKQSSNMAEKKTKMSFDQKLQMRIADHLRKNTQKAYVDIDEISRFLHGKFPDYQRYKYKQFNKIVTSAYEKLCEKMMKQQQEPEAKKEPPKTPITPSLKSKPSPANEVQIDSSSDDEQPKVTGSNMNKTMSNLYNTPSPSSPATAKTDYEKVKEIAKKVEQNGGLVKKTANSEKPKSRPSSTETQVVTIDLDPEPKPNANKESIAKEPSKEKETITNKKEFKRESTPQASEQTVTSTKTSRAASPTPLKIGNRKRKYEAAFKEVSTDFQDVAGMEDTLKSLLRLMIGLKVKKAAKNLKRILLLHGPTGCGKTLLANAIAGQLKWPLLEVNATEIVSGVSGESEAKLRTLFDQATNAGHPCVLFMDEIEVIAQKKDSNRGMENRIISQLKSCMDSLKGTQVLFIAATNGLDTLDLGLRSRFFEVAIGIPNERARRKIIEIIAKSMELELSPDVDFNQLARFTPSYVGRDFQDLCNEAEEMALERTINTSDTAQLIKVLETCENDEKFSGGLSIEMADFLKAIKKIQPAAKREGFATIPDVTWDDVGAMEEVRKQIELKVLARVNHPEAAKKFNLEHPTGVLLCGPPGCGKTLVAKAVANQAGINFISVKGPELLNMYVGESEKAVRQVFQRAKNSAPCVVFFDEIDALCPRRSSGSDSSGSNRVVTQMLTEMDGIEGRKGVYIMAATNRQEILDPAITRPGRLETMLYVGLPTNPDRVAILNALTKKKTRPDFAPDVSFEKLAENCEGYSGADLRALVTKASEMAFSESILKSSCDLRVNMKHFNHAMTSMRQSVEGKEKKRYEKMRQKLLVNESQNENQEETKAESDMEMTEKSDAVTDDVEMTESESAEISKTVIDAAIEASVTESTNIEASVAESNKIEASVTESIKTAAENSLEDSTGEEVKEKVEEPSETQDVVNSDQVEEKTKYPRYLPSMKVGVKGSGLLSQVIKSLEDNKVLIYGKDKTEISIHVKELEPYTPNPGDKAKSLNKDISDDTVFEVMKYDSDDDESMVVENVEDKEESTLKTDTLCALMEQ